MKKNQKRTYKIYSCESDVLNYSFSYNDKETSELHARLNGSTSITEDDLRRVSLWKSDRVLSVSQKTLDKLNELSAKSHIKIRDNLVKEVLEDLVISQGIGFPMASAILKFIKPTVFPIIDVRAYRALTGNKPYYTTYTYEKYMDYAERLTEISKRLNRPRREIDEQLYCYDKAANGEI